MERPEQATAVAAKAAWRRRLLRVGLVLVCSYGGVILVLLFLENKLVFHPTRASEDWQPPPSPEVQDIYLTTQEGTPIHAWWWPVKGSRGAILYCHGNAGNLSHRGLAMKALRDILGEAVLIFDYPGYGKSPGRPTEQGCYDAAHAAYDWLVNKQSVDPERLVIYGGSLGGGVATELAWCAKRFRALVLAKTFCALPEVGQSLYPWLPVRWLMRNRFDNLGRIGDIHKPVFIGSSPDDGLVPHGQSEKLFAAANQPKQFFSLPGDHNTPLPTEFFVSLRGFLQECEGQALNHRDTEPQRRKTERIEKR